MLAFRIISISKKRISKSFTTRTVFRLPNPRRLWGDAFEDLLQEPGVDSSTQWWGAPGGFHPAILKSTSWGPSFLVAQLITGGTRRSHEFDEWLVNQLGLHEILLYRIWWCYTTWNKQVFQCLFLWFPPRATFLGMTSREHCKSSISIFVIFWMVENSFSTMLELLSLTIPWGEGHNYTVGITPFTDLTRSEFRSRYGAPQQTMGRADAHAQRHPADFGRFSCFLEDNQRHQKASKVLKYQSLTALTSMNLLNLSLWNLPLPGACYDGAFRMANFWKDFSIQKSNEQKRTATFFGF